MFHNLEARVSLIASSQHVVDDYSETKTKSVVCISEYVKFTFTTLKMEGENGGVLTYHLKW